MAGARAPKQWCLTKNETITSFESWRHNLQYTLSLDPNFTVFLVDGTTWTRKSPANATRGITNDGNDIPEEQRRTAEQKVAHLELMLGQIANYCPVLSRNTIVKNSTSIQSVWQAIRMHFGFQSTGAHLLDFDSIHLEPDERPEDLFQRLTSFVEDNLLKHDGGISHHGDLPEADEELSPSLENLITLTWLRLLHKDLPSLVKQRYGPDLRAKTLASLKPEISQALDSLLDEIHSNNEAKVLRTAFKNNRPPSLTIDTRVQDSRNKTAKHCPLCKQAGRPRSDHYLSTCRFLPLEDKHFMSRARQSVAVEESASECPPEDEPCPSPHREKPTYDTGRQEVVGDTQIIRHHNPQERVQQGHIRRTQAFVLRSPSTTIWPGSYVDVEIPEQLPPEGEVAVEPRIECRYAHEMWPKPEIRHVVAGKIRLVNDTREPKQLKKNEHFCQVSPTASVDEFITNTSSKVPLTSVSQKTAKLGPNEYYSDAVKVDPDNILTPTDQQLFRDLLKEQDTLFNSQFTGYNNAAGKFEMTINMGPTQPPQRKGRLPQYSRDKLVCLQEKCDELESLGVLKKPEDVGITVEYLNPSFLVSKPNGGHRLVTAFEDVGRYSKPQPSLMPDVDSTLRTIGQWKYIIATDLTSAFYQIPLSKQSMKYCGIVTPFKGVRVYTRCAMGMPGSETALEELMCRVLGDQLQAGTVAKLADDLYCGGNTPEELATNWSSVMNALRKCDLRLSASKTIICPESTTILGWMWRQGRLSANPHKVSVLSTCKPPDTVQGLRSFLGAYKMLARVLPSCSQTLAPLENAICSLQSKDKIKWSNDLMDRFHTAQKNLRNTKEIVLPRRDDQLWIVTDGSVTKHGVGATLYVRRDNKILLAGFFSAKLRKHQVTWLPCEIEALCIAAAVKHFSPYLIQSRHNACVLTDSKPCVQAIQKLRRGEFSASPRVTSFLSTASRYQVELQHLAGSANVPSDFASRNAAECNNPSCQVCSFIVETEDSVVRSVNLQNTTKTTKTDALPFTTRSAWLNIQAECPDLRRTHAHLKQGTRPSRKLTNVRDIKRYLNVATIARDGLLVVRQPNPLHSTKELIVVPRSVIDGLVTALHIRLDHPTKHQMFQVLKRHFYALDMSQAVDNTCDSCHICASLKKFPKAYTEQTSEPPPDIVGINFAADVMKRNRQLIFILRETVTAYTAARIVPDEKHVTLRDTLLELCMELHPLDGPHAVVRVDPAPGFMAMREDELLNNFRINVEIGRIKNPNKNPVAEKAVAELGDELLKQEPGGGPVRQLGLAIAVARLNSRIRSTGLSAREMYTQRNQFTHEQLPIADRDIIAQKVTRRDANHVSSALSKSNMRGPHPPSTPSVGDLVYLYADRDKTRARPRYIVTSVEDNWYYVKKFTGSQLRSSSYKVKANECYRIPSEFKEHVPAPAPFEDAEDGMDTDYVPLLSENTPRPCQPAAPSPGDERNEPDPTPVPEVLSAPLPPCSDEQESEEPEEPPDAINEAPVLSRPQRSRKPPVYLKDYIVYR